LWNTKSEHYSNATACDSALDSIVQELIFRNSSVEDEQLKIKTIRTSYTAELSKAIKSGKKMAQVYTTSIVSKLFCLKQAH